jgi:hypothetical protein
MRGLRCLTVDTTPANFFYNSNYEVSFNTPIFAAVVDQYIEFDQQLSGHKYNSANQRKVSGPLFESVAL